MKLYYLLFLTVFLGCWNHETKKIASRYDNGKEEVVYFFKDKNDTLTYRTEVFYKSGKRMYIGNIIDDKQEGTWNWWYENGNKQDQCKFLNGKQIDTVFHWFENGKMKQMDIILNDVSNGKDSCSNCCNRVAKTYFENGKIELEGKYIDGNKEGKWFVGEKNGGWRINTYVNNILSGSTSEHNLDSSGRVYLVVGQYENGKETGLWKWFDKDSILYQTSVYENSLFNGPYVEFYRNGKIKSECILKKGKYDGLVKFYDENGTFQRSGLYEDKVPISDH